MPTRRALVVLALVLIPLSACRGKKAQLVEQSYALPNGLQVDLVSGPCGDGATVVVLFAVGTDHDPPGRSGLVHVLARSLATPERPVEAGADYTLFAVDVTRDGLPAAIDEAGARMGRLDLAAADLARGRADVIADLAKRHGGDATLTAVSYAAESVQPTRGNGWRGGIAADVEAITAAELQAFWQAHYAPGNARLVVVGRFDAAAIRQRIAAAFAPLGRGTPPVLRALTEATVTGTLVMGDAPAVVGLAIPAPATSAPVYPAFLVLVARLIGATSAQVHYDPVAAPETVLVSGPIQAGETPDAAAARIRAELAALIARPLAPADLAAAHQQLARFLGVHALEPATCRSDPRGFAIARARRAQLGLDGARLAQALAATTQAQLDEAAALFDPKRTAAVIAGGTIR